MKGVIFCLVPLLIGMVFLAIGHGMFIGVKREVATAGKAD